MVSYPTLVISYQYWATGLVVRPELVAKARPGRNITILYAIGLISLGFQSVGAQSATTLLDSGTP